MAKVDINNDLYKLKQTGLEVQEILDKVKGIDETFINGFINEHKNNPVLDHSDESVTTEKIRDKSITEQKLSDEIIEKFSKDNIIQMSVYAPTNAPNNGLWLQI